MALPGVDDQQPGGAGGGQQLLQRRDDGGELADVVAEGLTEPAGQQEVPLHVDHDQRHLSWGQRRTGSGSASTHAGYRWSVGSPGVRGLVRQ